MSKRSSRTRPINIAIVGAGKVGLVLGRILRDGGDRIVAVVSRTQASARRGGRFLRCRNASTDLSRIPPETDLIYITTPHAAIADVARALARVDGLRFRHLSVCHASGMHTAEVLSPLSRRGATVFSFHPLQTFPRDLAPERILPVARGIYFGVDGAPRGIRKANVLAGKLGGRVIRIPPEMRELYHAVCVLASNHLTTMLSVLETLFAALGTREKRFYPVFKPIIMATLRNVESTSPAKALSGPIARGGVETVARHFDMVRRFAPQLVPYFSRLSLETVRLATAKGSINESQRTALVDLIRSHMNVPMTEDLH